MSFSDWQEASNAMERGYVAVRHRAAPEWSIADGLMTSGEDEEGAFVRESGLRSLAFVFLTALLLVGGPLGRASADERPESSIALGDAAWAERASSLDGQGLLARPQTIERAIHHYRDAVAGNTDSLEARWKLLRAMHYSIDFTTLEEAARDRRAEAAVGFAEESVGFLDDVEGTAFDRARVYFWSGIAWGVRANRVGLLTVVREGAAGRMHDYADRSLELDERVDEGGALRLLARLHATLPKVPFLSGWVNRGAAIPLAERAVALAPAHPGSQLVLALTLLDIEPERRLEAREALLRAVAIQPRTTFRVEDRVVQAQARARLSELEGSRGGAP